MVPLLSTITTLEELLEALYTSEGGNKISAKLTYHALSIPQVEQIFANEDGKSGTYLKVAILNLPIFQSARQRNLIESIFVHGVNSTSDYKLSPLGKQLHLKSIEAREIAAYIPEPNND